MKDPKVGLSDEEVRLYLKLLRGLYQQVHVKDEAADEICAEIARLRTLGQAPGTRHTDTEILDALESCDDIANIEPGGAFSDGLWTIWSDSDHERLHLGRGKTLREAVSQWLSARDSW